ncbi:hypothetical protein SAMN05443144_13317 [Fodinibius roseus]|uniref:DUF4625 domain-containing protein n=1 Tax=Fodinibius roseus TaxID=1194090 RepID=A0A1M5KNU5_9BACT|nr:hypothetical protein [Fodinibius roseus]SHG54396.1 hypothetical protein SAMN05443144_13317 [Fodinibius roseus]
MFKIKSLVVLFIPALLFFSCDETIDDSYTNHISFTLPEGDGIAEVKLGENYEYIGEIHHGPAEALEIEHSEFRPDENYSGWLKGELINEGHAFKITGTPDTIDTFHFFIRVKRKDSTANIGSYSLGFNIEVLEEK